MKKLLGLLAAFGLTASAGSAVVACGDKDPKEKEDVKEVSVVLTVTLKADAVEADVKTAIEKLEVVAEGKADEEKAKSEEAAIEAVKKVTGVEDAAVKAAKDEAKTIEATVKVKFTVKAEEAKLVDIKDAVVAVKAGEKKAEVEAKILAAIVKIAPEAKAADFKITDLKDETVADDVIKVAAVDGSTVLTGNLEITVTADEEVSG